MNLQITKNLFINSLSGPNQFTRRLARWPVFFTLADISVMLNMAEFLKFFLSKIALLFQKKFI
jgi:hypothetical protein